MTHTITATMDRRSAASALAAVDVTITGTRNRESFCSTALDAAIRCASNIAVIGVSGVIIGTASILVVTTMEVVTQNASVAAGAMLDRVRLVGMTDKMADRATVVMTAAKASAMADVTAGAAKKTNGATAVGMVKRTVMGTLTSVEASLPMLPHLPQHAFSRTRAPSLGLKRALRSNRAPNGRTHCLAEGVTKAITLGINKMKDSALSWSVFDHILFI